MRCNGVGGAGSRIVFHLDGEADFPLGQFSRVHMNASSRFFRTFPYGSPLFGSDDSDGVIDFNGQAGIRKRDRGW